MYLVGGIVNVIISWAWLDPHGIISTRYQYKIGLIITGTDHNCKS